MKFTWITHSCFKIRLESGLELLFDPFNNEIGYEPIDLTTDILFVSHQHFDHNYVECVKGDYVLMDKPGEYQVKDVKITGFPSVHDHHGGANRGDNIIFKIEAEGMSICLLYTSPSTWETLDVSPRRKNLKLSGMWTF